MNTLSLRIEQYEAGYDQGKKDWYSGGLLQSPLSQPDDEDYRNGYRDGATNRLKDPPREASRWPEDRSPGWWHGGE
jgi:hypothetical protein